MDDLSNGRPPLPLPHQINKLHTTPVERQGKGWWRRWRGGNYKRYVNRPQSFPIVVKSAYLICPCVLAFLAVSCPKMWYAIVSLSSLCPLVLYSLQSRHPAPRLPCLPATTTSSNHAPLQHIITCMHPSTTQWHLSIASGNDAFRDLVSVVIYNPHPSVYCIHTAKLQGTEKRQRKK